MTNTSKKSINLDLSKGSNKRLLKKYAPLYIMLIPFLLYYVFFKFKPLGGLLVAFQDYQLFKGIEGSEWVGFENFKRFLSTPYFYRTVKNTIVLNLVQLIFAFPLPIIFALLLNEVRSSKLKKSIQTISYMPHFISAVVVVGIIVNLLSPSYGIITSVYEFFTGERPYFMTNPKYFRTIYVTMTLWQNMGYNAIVYIAALSAVDRELYEAAEIDGASKLKQVFHITIPSIMPTIITMLIVKVGTLMNSATDTILLLQQPATYEVSDVLGTYVYRSGIVDGDYAMATAVQIFNTAIGYVLVFVTNKISKKYTEAGLW